MSRMSPAAEVEHGILLAEIEALERRRDAALADLTAAHARLERESLLAAAASERASRQDENFRDGAAVAAALEARVEQARQEAMTCAEVAESARRDLGVETAAVSGLLARVATLAAVLGDEQLRRWARRGISSPEAP